MIRSGGFSMQTGKRLPDAFQEFMSIPTPFGGRSAASAGPRWADYRVRKTLTNYSGCHFSEISRAEKTGIDTAAGCPSGRRHTSQPGDAHAAGAEPPRASINTKKIPGKVTSRAPCITHINGFSGVVA